MNIYAPPGSKIKYSEFNNGYRYDKNIAEKHLIRGEIYTVLRTDVSNYHTSVYLVEVPNIGFNSVMFSDVNEDIQSDETVAQASARRRAAHYANQDALANKFKK